MVGETRPVGGIEANDPSEVPRLCLELVLQIVEKPLVVGGNQDLAATEHGRDEPGNSAPMIDIVGGDDVIQRDDGRAEIKLLDRRHSQRQRHRMDL